MVAPVAMPSGAGDSLLQTSGSLGMAEPDIKLNKTALNKQVLLFYVMYVYTLKGLGHQYIPWYSYLPAGRCEEEEARHEGGVRQGR